MTKSECCWKESMKKEMEEIQRHCALEREKHGPDIDPQCAALDWIEKNAAEFRKRWEEEG